MATNHFKFALVSVAILLAGCTGKPNQANIELRKQNQELTSQVSELKRQREADLATIDSLQKDKGTLQTLPQERLDKLFTVHGLSLGKLTGGSDLDSNKPGDEGVKIYVVPLDQHEQPIKAAGTFTIEAFDLSRTSQPLIGTWNFPLEELQKNWYSSAMLYTYALPCVWQTVPVNPEITIKVTFRDELTQRAFSAQRVVKIHPPPGPVTAPSSAAQ